VRISKICSLVVVQLMLLGVMLVATDFERVVYAGDQVSVTVYFVDVGQGDSIFIDTSGLDVLVDGGTRTAGITVLNFLQDLDISQIDLIVATHMDADHIGGLIPILNSSVQVGEVIVNNQTGTTVTYSDFMSLANTHSVVAAQRGDVYVLAEDVNFTVLNPVQPSEFSEQNENSVAMRLQIGGASFLLMGDAEADTEESILVSGLEVDSDVLKVGHHGSNSSTTDAFLNAVSPSIAVISAGLNNPYGHPHQETLDKLFAHQVTMYGTYHSGTIIISANSTSLQVLNNPAPIPEYTSLPVVAALFITVTIMVLWWNKKRKPALLRGKV
jgi:competence protein ComEC